MHVLSQKRTGHPQGFPFMSAVPQPYTATVPNIDVIIYTRAHDTVFVFVLLQACNKYAQDNFERRRTDIYRPVRQRSLNLRVNRNCMATPTHVHANETNARTHDVMQTLSIHAPQEGRSFSVHDLNGTSPYGARSQSQLTRQLATAKHELQSEILQIHPGFQRVCVQISEFNSSGSDSFHHAR
jgi:hypothetical protein